MSYCRSSVIKLTDWFLSKGWVYFSIAIFGAICSACFNFGMEVAEERLLIKQVPSAQALADNIVKEAELRDIMYNLSDNPYTIDIIRCESGFKAKAFNLKTKDIGYFQINEYWHREKSLLSGYDVYNPIENLEYGLKLLSEPDGLKYWTASEHCWRKR